VGGSNFLFSEKYYCSFLFWLQGKLTKTKEGKQKQEKTKLLFQNKTKQNYKIIL